MKPKSSAPHATSSDSHVLTLFDENFQVCGVRKVWRQMKREGHDLARCAVARDLRGLGLKGIIRGRKVRTTFPHKAAPCPFDHFNRQCRAARPNVLWVSDFIYVATWQRLDYVAFVIDVLARRVVG